MKVLRARLLGLLGCLLVLYCLYFLSNAAPVVAAAPPVERILLTPSLLQARLNSPIFSEGVYTIDLQHFIIDLTEENAEFREEFYQQLQNNFNRSQQPLGLDLSGSLIQGEWIGSKIGLPTPLAKAALPQLLTPSEQEQLEQDAEFLPELEEKINTVFVFRGPLKMRGTIFKNRVDFSKMFFLQRLEAVGGKFNEGGSWSATRFSRTADFSQVIFGQDIDFSNSTFFKEAKFNQVQWGGTANFSRTFFWKRASFSQSQFFQYANLTGSQWLKNVDFEQVIWRDRALFSKAHFFESVSLVNSTFEKSVSFRAVRFGQSVNFQDVRLLEQVDFSNAFFGQDSILNVSGLAFDSDRAKILGDTGVIGRVISLSKLKGNETVIRNLLRNFRRLEQIADANQIEYKTQKLRLQQLRQQISLAYPGSIWQWQWFLNIFSWLFLSLLILLSNYGTSFSLVMGIGIFAIAYFGFLYWLIDRLREQFASFAIQNRQEILDVIASFIFLNIIGITNIFKASARPWLVLGCLGVILIPLPVWLVSLLYRQRNRSELVDISYFLLDGSMRELRLLIVRLPVVPEFPFFRDRYTPLAWERRWNWLNYYDFSCNNWLKLGFNDLRLRDKFLPGTIATLVWYQWSLGLLYIVLLFWTLSRTIPGLNLLIYLK